MKKKGRLWICLLMLVFSMALCTQGASAVRAASSDAGSSAAVKKKGWITTSKGKQYYKNGTYLTGLQKIGSKYYYFSAKGYLKKNANIKDGKWTYYTKSDGTGAVDGRSKGSKYYTMAGKQLTGTAKEEYMTKLRARKIVRKITNDKMSLSKKRLTCFKWVSNHPYMHYRNFSRFSGWTSTYANDHFIRGRGNCVADACAFAYLAEALGYKKVSVCLDGRGDSAHSWCEINGRVFDPLFAQVKRYGFSKSYNVPYSVYPDPWVVIREKIC